ncbi:MAG: DUF3320 domain-containing protein, partial [Bdellovibrionales bacterium]
EGESEEDIVEDLESILDDCIGARIPWLPLNWHYRSRHESLITFSNYHYYGNRLLTFPSPDMEGMGVSWRYVANGIYDKGKSRTNRAEAEAVVEEVLTRLEDSELSQFSIGIVTFSLAQQTLIEDLLDEARGDNPELDHFFSSDTLEPVFVKNLENVQGDERDIILFSICYGPDSLGRISMNFGPMNREGGERRLNVAVTRARREVLVFSSLKAEEIDLARTRARGVRDLKNFLEYAAKGPSAIAEAVQLDPEANFDSPFEEAVYDALVQRGWQVHKQVGCARYRIDLAVVDPENPGRYLLGVECDGANYHRAKTARDRDKLREAVLEDLGWQLHRIWSTDWWTNPTQQIEKLETVLEDATGKPFAQKIQKAPELNDQTITSKAVVLPENKKSGRIAKGGSPKAKSSSKSTMVEDVMEVYKPLAITKPLGSRTDFYKKMATLEIIKKIIEVVRKEGPISLRLAAKRIALFWGIQRISDRVIDHVRKHLPKGEVIVESSIEGEFLWPGTSIPADYTRFRIPGKGEDGTRSIEDIPLEEIQNAVLYLLASHISAPQGELVRETARLFGFQRSGKVLEEHIGKSLQRLVDQEKVRVEGEIVSLVR